MERGLVAQLFRYNKQELEGVWQDSLVGPAKKPIGQTFGLAQVASTTNVGHFDLVRILSTGGSFLGVPIVAIYPNFGYCINNFSFVDPRTD